MEVDKKQLIKVLAICILGTLLFGTAVLFSYMYYSKHIRPEKYPDEPKTDYEADREAEVHRRLPGMDMFDVIRRYRRRNYMNRVIAIVVCCILLIAGRKEFSYSHELDFKKAIEKNGIDSVRLNADFMMGSHFYLRDGLAVLGRDYMVSLLNLFARYTKSAK